jgi:hypothetical protein
LSHPDSMKYFQEHQDRVMAKLQEWNALATLKRPEFTRKMEGSGNITDLHMRIIQPFGLSFFDFIDFARIYEKTSAYRIMRDTVAAMNKKKWTGIVTPKMCVFLLQGKTINSSDATKLNELDIE